LAEQTASTPISLFAISFCWHSRVWPRKQRQSDPALVSVSPSPSLAVGLQMKPIALDAADIRILCALQDHGQISKSRLAELVGLSPTPCWARLTRLKKAGMIRGYHADIVLAQIVEMAKVVVTVSLKSHRKADFERFESFVQSRPEVTDCISTGGGMDYVMTVVTTSLADFQALMEAMLDADLAIDRYMTYIATRQIKSGRPDLATLAIGQMAKRDLGA
jgi:Lrp/AsnC family transcriptional regulator of ectoine degradation